MKLTLAIQTIFTELFRRGIPFLISGLFFLFGTGKVYPDIGLQFAIPAMQSGLEKIEQWTPIVSYLEEACGFEIVLNIEKDHSAVIQGLQDKFFDAALVSALYETKTLSLHGISSRLRLEINGSQTYSSCLIVPENSAIRSPGALGGQYLALTVPRESLGGYYIPLMLLYDNGLDPYKQFRQIIYSETYESILKGVAYGLLDTGAVTFQFLSDKKNIHYRDKLRIIAQSGEIPQPAIVVQVGAREEMIEKLITEMSRMNRAPEGIQILSDSGIDRFAPVEERQLRLQPEILKKIEVIDALAR